MSSPIIIGGAAPAAESGGGGAIVLVVLLLVICLMGLGYYLYTQSQKSSDTSDTPAPDATPTAPLADQPMYAPSPSGSTPSSTPGSSAPTYVLIGVGTDNKLYTKTSATSPWTAAVQAKSGDTIRSASQANDGTLLAVGTDNRLYTRANITDSNSPYKAATTADAGWRFYEFHQRSDGTYFALGDGNSGGRLFIFTGDPTNLTQGPAWGSFCCTPNGVNISAKDPTILIGANGSGDLWAKKFNNQNQGDGDWGGPTNNKIITGLTPAMLSATQLADGSYIYIGTDNKTYTIPSGSSGASSATATSDTQQMLSLANWDSTKVQAAPQAPTTTSTYAPEPVNPNFYDFMGIVQ